MERKLNGRCDHGVDMMEHCKLCHDYNASLEKKKVDLATTIDYIIGQWCSKYNLHIDWSHRCNLRKTIYDLFMKDNNGRI